MDSTAKCRLDAAALLFNTNTRALAALYATNARYSTSQQPYTLPLSPLHCPRCAHLPVSTRIVASKHGRTSKTMRLANKKHNKTLLAQMRKSEASSHSRGLRVRVVRSCARCGYVGAEASEAPVQTRTASPSPAAAPDCASASSSSSVLVSPAMNKETETATATQDIVDLESSAESKAKPCVETTTTVASSPAAKVTAHIKDSGSPVSDSKVLLSQSGSAAKRRKKKTGLQEMLARSKEQRMKDEKQEGSGLAAFLSGL